MADYIKPNQINQKIIFIPSISGVQTKYKFVKAHELELPVESGGEKPGFITQL